MPALSGPRPRLHFTAASGWINDPHGITFRDGRYHVFYQYVPDRTQWGVHCHWGHASGPDLLTLAESPPAIAPGDGDDGVWTGSITSDDEGRPVAFYTSASTLDLAVARIRRATPDDPQLLSWTKGPVVAEAPDGLDVVAFRDPFVRREDARWRMFVGAGLRDGTAAVVSYTSTDLETWTHDGIALRRSTHETSPVWLGSMWECPQVFDLDGRTVMVASVWDQDVLHHVGYAIGTFRDGVLTAQSWGALTHGDGYYAPSTFTDADGRPALLFWVRGVGGARWTGALSVPYRLSIDGDRLCATPHPDVAAHRGGRAGSGTVPDPVSGTVPDPAADIVWRDAPTGDLAIRTGDAPAVVLSRADGELTVVIDGRSTRLPVSGDLRIVIDAQVLEVSSPAGLFAASVTPDAGALTVTATTGDVDVFALTTS